MIFKFTWLTSLAFPTATYVSSFQHKTNVIVRYGAVCMCAVSVDFSLYLMTDCKAGLLTVCSPLRLLSAPTHVLQRRYEDEGFPIDTPLVLRLVKTHMGKCLFSPELKSYLITQWNCTTIGSCRCRKRTNGSAAELHEPMATIRANIPAETGGASGYISGRFAIGSSDFFSFSDDDFVYADPEKPTRRWHASQ